MTDKTYTADGSVCLTDVCRGLVDAIIAVRKERTVVSPLYCHIPARHVRRLAARATIVEPLNRLEATLTATLRRLQEQSQ